MAQSGGLFGRSAVAEVEITEKHQSYFTLTANVVTGNQKGSICTACSAANLIEDALPPLLPFSLFNLKRDLGSEVVEGGNGGLMRYV